MLYENNIKWWAKVLGPHSSCSAMETHDTKFPVHSLCADVSDEDVWSSTVTESAEQWRRLCIMPPQHLTILLLFSWQLLWSECLCFLTSSALQSLAVDDEISKRNKFHKLTCCRNFLFSEFIWTAWSFTNACTVCLHGSVFDFKQEVPLAYLCKLFLGFYWS